MRNAVERMVGTVEAEKKLCRLLRSRDGSSLISVLVAFIILLIGIAGFARAVRTANDMVRRAEQLNTATGKILCGADGFEGFYSSYADAPKSESILKVYETDGASGTASEAFKLHGLLRTREYTVKVSDEEGETPITYTMHFYK